MESDETDFIKYGNLLYIKKPDFSESNYVSLLWSDGETMKDVGGTVQFPAERWLGWYSKMVHPSDGRNFYCVVYNNENIPVGEVSFHRYNEESKTVELNVKFIVNTGIRAMDRKP